MNRQTLNLFYDEPAPDRWLPLDRFPRNLVRRLVRGRPRVGGHKRVFLNLCAGLDRIGAPYRVNDYRHALRHLDEWACIVGKPGVLEKIKWQNPILFGAAVFSHPLDDPNLLDRLPVKRVLVPCEWMRRMFEPYYGDKVTVWPVGINLDQWTPSAQSEKNIDFLIYDKVMWGPKEGSVRMASMVSGELEKKHVRVRTIRYGHYKEEEYRALLASSKAMVFLCEHETQGIAYQEALACGVPLLVWDGGGFWKDPTYYPERVQFAPVTAVPYWDDRCGMKFRDLDEFSPCVDEFLTRQKEGRFDPRAYIAEELSLEKCARRYLTILKEAGGP